MPPPHINAAQAKIIHTIMPTVIKNRSSPASFRSTGTGTSTLSATDDINTSYCKRNKRSESRSSDSRDELDSTLSLRK